MDSANSQTISSLLLAPSQAEERGLTSSMVLIKAMVSFRCKKKKVYLKVIKYLNVLYILFCFAV